MRHWWRIAVRKVFPPPCFYEGRKNLTISSSYLELAQEQEVVRAVISR